MRDEQGRTRLERWKENRFENSFQDDVTSGIKDVMEHPENIAILKKFTSTGSLTKSILPQLIVGSLLGYVEYRIVGIVYTIISLVILFPLLYGYSVSLRTRNGVFAMYPTEDMNDWERIFISDQIWSLVKKETGLTMETSRINSRVTYWCKEVKFISGTNIPYYVNIAWRHYNTAKFGLFASIIDDLTDMVQGTLLENAKLQQTSKVEAIAEGKRQTKEMIEHIESAFRDNAYDIIKKQEMDEEQARIYQKQVDDLLQNPTFLRGLMEKRRREEEKNEHT